MSVSKKEALDSCGRLKKGYMFKEGGAIVKVSATTKTKKKSSKKATKSKTKKTTAKKKVRAKARKGKKKAA